MAKWTVSYQFSGNRFDRDVYTLTINTREDLGEGFREAIRKAEAAVNAVVDEDANIVGLVKE